jgi:hypothetical protein
MRASSCLAAAVILAGAAVAVFSPRAVAEIRIIKTNGDPVPPEAYAIAFNPKTGSYDITLLALYAPGLESVFDIRGNGGEYINSVIIAVDGPPAGSPLIVRVQGEKPGLLQGVGSILQTGSGETILNRVQVTQDIGEVTVQVMGDLIAGRDVIGPITATTPNNALRGIVSVQAGRDILGNVTADNGRILLVLAERDIGSAASPIAIRARHNVYQVMGEQVFADINTRFNGGTGGFWAMVANRFTGTLRTEQLIPNPWNGLDARIAIYDVFDGTISIGKSYNSPTQYIEVPAHGLAGQIIVNADNVPSGAWTSPVRVGPNGDPQQIILNNALYTHSAAQIGGGSVGLVPFHLHHQACSPANGATVQLGSNAPPLTVELPHYGPVTWTSGSPVTIDRRPAGTSGVWMAVNMSNFSIERSAAARSLLISRDTEGADQAAGFEPGYQYRIRATPNLVCDLAQASAAPTVVWDGDYIITVLNPPCLGDIDGNGVVEVDDLIFIILFWGPVSPTFPAPDTNEDGAVDVDDLIAVILHWGACP